MPLARMGVRGSAPYQDCVLGWHLDPIWFCLSRLVARYAISSI